MLVDFHRKFKKELEKLPQKQQKQFWGRIELFSRNPFHPILNNHQLRGNMKNTRSINISGDIRAIYKATDKDAVLFLTIASHSELYDN